MSILEVKGLKKIYTTRFGKLLFRDFCDVFSIQEDGAGGGLIESCQNRCTGAYHKAPANFGRRADRRIGFPGLRRASASFRSRK